jgi:hypothetical protein
MRWVTEVVKLNDDYKFCLEPLVLGSVTLSTRGISSCDQIPEDTHLNSIVWQAYSSHAIKGGGDAPWSPKTTKVCQLLATPACGKTNDRGQKLIAHSTIH